jgi:hypothetical protein
MGRSSAIPSRGGALSATSRDVGLPVFYHLYNRWEVPMEQRIPLTDATPPAGMPPHESAAPPWG